MFLRLVGETVSQELSNLIFRFCGGFFLRLGSSSSCCALDCFFSFWRKQLVCFDESSESNSWWRKWRNWPNLSTKVHSHTYLLDWESLSRTYREGALLHYSCRRGSYYSGGRSNRVSTVYLLDWESLSRTNREGALLHYSCRSGSYYSWGRSNRVCTVYLLDWESLSRIYFVYWFDFKTWNSFWAKMQTV